ncbi:MAG: hypothetical protein J6U66_13170 [Lachnospiraceae bacterium]|nr:hypothetical protein [Lachnospiraceae bacterium]
MLNETQAVKKLEECAAKFRAAIIRKDWGVAHNLYMEAIIVTAFMEMGDTVKKKLYGDWDSDDGSDTDTALDNGLFSREDVDRVNKECCILRNMAYEDQTCRRQGRPVEYYGDPDFCARCEDRKRAARRWTAL